MPRCRFIAVRLACRFIWSNALKTGLALIPIVAVTLLQFSVSAQAQDSFPSRPVRIVVPYPPGAVTDAICRVVAIELGKVIGQTVIVDNKPGG
jgi:tripartite-type tricarboxylate transporter receptor subunit TctC